MRSVLLVLAVTACGFEHGRAPRDGATTDDVPNDMLGLDVMVDAALGPWSAPVQSFTAATDDDPTLTTDMLEMYFNRAADIYVVRRNSINEDWSLPALVNELSTIDIETTPEITGDGLMMFFSSNRQGSKSNSVDIWFSKRASRSDPWGTPVNVPELSTNASDTCSAPTDDGLTIVWNDENPEDLYISRRTSTSDAWPQPQGLSSVNTTARDLGPMLSQDLRTLYFASNRDGDEDLFVATRTALTDSFGTTAPISELNTASVENDPWISADGRHMFFSSNRSGQSAIYEVSR